MYHPDNKKDILWYSLIHGKQQPQYEFCTDQGKGYMDIYLGHWKHLNTTALSRLSSCATEQNALYHGNLPFSARPKGEKINTLAISDGHPGPPLVIDQILPLNDVRKERVGAILRYSGEEVVSPNSLSYSSWHTWTLTRLTAALTFWWGSDRTQQDWEGWGGTDLKAPG